MSEEIDLSEFRDVERYKGRLLINKTGDLYSTISKKILKPIVFPNGYIGYAIMMKNPRRTKTEYQHRLLAETFIQNPQSKETVNHIDGNKKNNALDNLEWATQSENNKHALDHGLRESNTTSILKHNKERRHFTDEEVRFIRQMKGKMTAPEIVRYLGKGSVYAIHDIFRGRTYKDVLCDSK